MRWSELDLAARVWRLPASRVKNARAHEVPLSDAAVEIIQGLPRIGDVKDGYVFTTTSFSPVSGFSRAKRAIDRTIIEIMREEAEARGNNPDSVTALLGWRLHDLRRTVATSLQKLGVRLEVTEAILNHVSGSRAGIVGVYQRHEYAAEKRAALDAWARRLEAIVSGAEPSNVDARDMAHLAVGADFELAVKMQAEVRLGENVAPLLRVLADEIVHFDPAAPRRRPERPAGDGADVLLELRRLRPVERPVAGIVDARRDLIDDEALAAVAVAGDEHLDRQNSDVIELLEHGGGNALGLGRRLGD